MATPWPNTLQQVFDSDTFSMVPGVTTIRSDVDAGPAKVRSRFTDAVDNFQASIVIDYAEYNTLMTFYKTSLSNGALPFTMDHPFTGTPVDFRFVSPPQIRPLGNGGRAFKVSFDLEQLP